MWTGSCLCGACEFTIEGPLESMAHCHCARCRKSHGTAFATFVTFAREGLRWVRGEEGVRRYASSPGTPRAFCGRCGSKLPEVEPFVYAFAGALAAEALPLAPEAHLCVGSKAPWHTIVDDLPQHEALRPGEVSVATTRHTEPVADKVRGSCLCGRAAYEIDGPLEGGGIVSCHCGRCRRARAAAYGSNLFVAPEAFRWLRGEEAIRFYKLPDAARFGQSFCETCGSVMPAAVATPGRRVIPCGSLDDDPGVRELMHIFVGSKATWFEIADGLPQHETYPREGFPPVARPRT